MLFKWNGNRQISQSTTQESETLTVYPWAFLFVVKVLPNLRSKHKVSRIFVCDFEKRNAQNPFKAMKNKYIAQDRIAMRIADRYGMTREYKIARRHNLTPLEALEDWDLIMPEERDLFKN